MRYDVEIDPVASITISVDANSEDDAYVKALSQWVDIEPNMRIVKVTP
jgi:hypothetical protein